MLRSSFRIRKNRAKGIHIRIIKGSNRIWFNWNRELYESIFIIFTLEKFTHHMSISSDKFDSIGRIFKYLWEYLSKRIITRDFYSIFIYLNRRNRINRSCREIPTESRPNVGYCEIRMCRIFDNLGIFHLHKELKRVYKISLYTPWSI